MQIDQLDQDLYLLQGETYASNSKVFVRGSEALLVDGLASRADAEQLKQFVEGDLGKKVHTILCTHYFSDHLAALTVFRDSEVIAHRYYGHTFSSELYRSEEERRFFRKPTILVEHTMELRWGRYMLNVFHNPGHTMSTMGVDVPEASLLLAADTTVGNIAYLFYADPDLLLAALQRLRTRARPTVLASHLGIQQARVLDNAIYYLGALREHAREAWNAADAKSALEQILLSACLPAGLSGTDFEAIFHKRNLLSIFERQLFRED
jgi:glyoxylase-like metal-dependent hydrolase (beta-lactamase superfamily II)